MRLLVLLCMLALSPVAARGASQAAPDAFFLTVTGTATAAWQHTDCDAALASAGSRTAHFRSSAPTLVRFVGGRIRPVEAHGVAGAVVLKGVNISGITCSEDAAPAFDACSRTTRRFHDARVRLSAAGAGRIVIGAPRVELSHARCPREPGDVVSLPLGQQVGPLRVSPHLLGDRRNVRITVSTSATRRKTYGMSEQGALTLRATWKLTFVRTDR
jgi:hypothetical protein